MPLNPEDFQAIQAGIGQLGNVYASTNLSKKQRQWNEKMFEREIAINRENWEMQNVYNSPTEQMKRLKAAGLNPHLVYGHGATATGGDIGGASPGAWNPSPPRFDPDSFMGFYDVQMKQATVDNLEVQNKVLQNEALLKQAQVIATIAATGKTNVETAQLESVSDLVRDNMINDIAVKSHTASESQMRETTGWNRDEREAAMTASNLSEAVARIGAIRIQNAKTDQERRNLEQQFQLLKGDAMLKQMDLDLRRQGIEPGTPGWLRALFMFMRSK